MASRPCQVHCEQGGKELQRLVKAHEVRLTGPVLRAQDVEANDQLWLCLSCGRVRHRIFDKFLARFRMVEIGVFDHENFEFLPGPWLQKRLLKDRTTRRNRKRSKAFQNGDPTWPPSESQLPPGES